MKKLENRKRKHHANKYHEPAHKRNFHDGNGGSGFHKNGGNNHLGSWIVTGIAYT
jgi:hypothetical protein